LPQSRHTRKSIGSELIVAAKAIAGGDVVKISDGEGTWTDEAHLPFQHVKELGQLIDAEIPEKFAHLQQPGVLLQQKESACRLVSLIELDLFSFRVLDHRPKLEHIELVATLHERPPQSMAGRQSQRILLGRSRELYLALYTPRLRSGRLRLFSFRRSRVGTDEAKESKPPSLDGRELRGGCEFETARPKLLQHSIEVLHSLPVRVQFRS